MYWLQIAPNFHNHHTNSVHSLHDNVGALIYSYICTYIGSFQNEMAVDNPIPIYMIQNHLKYSVPGWLPYILWDFTIVVPCGS